MAIHIFRNIYSSAEDNHFICSLLDKDFALLKKNKNKKHFKNQHEFPDRCSKQRIYTYVALTVGQGLLSDKGRGGMLFISSVSSLSLIFLSPLSLSFISSTISYLFSLSLGDDTKWPTRVDVSLNPNSVKSITCCPMTKHGPFTDLRTNKKFRVRGPWIVCYNCKI